MSAPRILPAITEPVYPAGWPNPSRRRWYWSAEELRVLRERYITEGLAACLALLPGRSAIQVLNKADRLGMVRQKKHERRPEPPPGLDAALRDYYRRGKRGGLQTVARRFGWPRSWLYLRARELGLDMVRRGLKLHVWSDTEDAILRQHCTLGLRTIAQRLIAAGFERRTDAAIYERMSRLGLRRLAKEEALADGYTASALAQAMGEDVSTVLRWIRAGRLRARRRDDLAGMPWVIRHEAVRAFLIAHPGAWDHRRCDKYWLLDALVGDLGDLAARAA